MHMAAIIRYFLNSIGGILVVVFFRSVTIDRHLSIGDLLELLVIVSRTGYEHIAQSLAG